MIMQPYEYKLDLSCVMSICISIFTDYTCVKFANTVLLMLSVYERESG